MVAIVNAEVLGLPIFYQGAIVVMPIVVLVVVQGKE
jgi:hypothetical protein